MTIALKGADITIRRGEIRGLIGENGSGKSTIMSIAAGMQGATGGEMLYKGKKWNPASMIDAQRQGISMILQEANTIPGISVAHNIFAGREREFTSCGIVHMRKMIRAAQALLDRYGIGYIHAQDSIDRYGFEDRNSSSSFARLTIIRKFWLSMRRPQPFPTMGARCCIN